MQERFLSKGSGLNIPKSAFILAAGHGTRLRPYTDEVPKPFVEVRGRPMIDYALDALGRIGVGTCAVNTHYKAEVLHEHLARRTAAPAVHISHEDELLNTGGGVRLGIKRFAEHFEDDFYVLNGDAFWEDTHGGDALLDLARAWRPQEMDILMLLQPVSKMKLTEGVGDYDILPDGRAVRSMDKTGTHMFTSLRINSPRIFEGTAQGAFSYLDLMDAAEKAGRLYGLEYQGDWHHISAPPDLEAVNERG